MDNIKTGNLIKELRKAKGMTQKDLADKLHITDRAVSKWSVDCVHRIFHCWSHYLKYWM